MTLFSRANNGARGKAATKMVTNPYWITEMKQQRDRFFYNRPEFLNSQGFLCKERNGWHIFPHPASFATLITGSLFFPREKKTRPAQWGKMTGEKN